MSRESDLPRTDPVAQREVPNRYSRLLEAVSGGHALFKPQSNVLPQRGGVIGDGGYIDKGRFIWLFNVFKSAPEGIPGLDWSEDDDVVLQTELNTTVLKSSTASSVRFYASAGTDASALPLGLPPTSIEPKVNLKESAFAFLAFAGRERDVRVLKRHGRAKLKEWLVQHYEQLYALYEGDVVLICETVQSSGWLGGLAYHDLNQVSGDVEVTVPGFSFGAGFTRERETEIGLMCTCGPGSEVWTEESPPSYTVIVGLVVARRQRMARMRRKLAALFASQGGQSSSTSGSNHFKPPSSYANATSGVAGSSSLALEGDQPALDAADTESASDTSLREVGDDNILVRLLDEALASHSDAQIAVADWSLINDYTNIHGELPAASDIRFDVEWSTVGSEDNVLHVVGLTSAPLRDVQDIGEQENTPGTSFSQEEMSPTSSITELMNALSRTLDHSTPQHSIPPTVYVPRAPDPSPSSPLVDCFDGSDGSSEWSYSGGTPGRRSSSPDLVEDLENESTGLSVSHAMQSYPWSTSVARAEEVSDCTEPAPINGDSDLEPSPPHTIQQCDACRRKRIRCSRDSPTAPCARCLKRNVSCTFGRLDEPNLSSHIPGFSDSQASYEHGQSLEHDLDDEE